MTWTLEGELNRQAGRETLSESLADLGLIPSPCASYALRLDEEWLRGGEETYLMRFWIAGENGAEAGYLVKACVSANMSQSLGETVSEWVRRRRLLHSAGVSTPHLVSASGATIIEELIPYTFRERFGTRTELRSPALEHMVDYGAALTRCGFRPIDPFSDLMSRGDDLVPVDFGQDLGPTGFGDLGSKVVWNAFIETAQAWGLLKTTSNIALLWQRYEAMVRLGSIVP